MQAELQPGKYVYVVCSTDNDHFAEIASVSMTSLRLASPQARITVLTDRQTSTVNSPGVAAVRAAADDFTIVDCPGNTTIYRSRFLKTGMRSLVSGRFLYLDSDTVIMRSPDAIWGIDCDVAASPDVAPNGKSYLSSTALPDTTRLLGWTLGTPYYLNSGVIYLADTEAAYSVGEQYRAGWSESLRATGKSNDQLGFNRAVHVAGARLNVLPLSYNAQISMNPLLLSGAKIVHFFTVNLESSVETIAHTTAKRLKRDGVLDTSALGSAIESGNPWTRIDSYRKAFAARRYAHVGKIAFDRFTKRLGL